MTLNQEVEGSNPSRPTNRTKQSDNRTKQSDNRIKRSNQFKVKVIVGILRIS